jgi:hypothetical protein
MGLITKGFLVLACVAGLSAVARAQSAPNVYYNTFEYADMRPSWTWQTNHWRTSGQTLLAPGEMPNQPSGVYTGLTIAGWNFNYPPAYVNDASICRGNWCYKITEPAGGNGTNGGSYEFSVTDGQSMTSVTEHLFYRWAMKFPAGHEFVYGKLAYLRDWDGNTAMIIPYCPSATQTCNSTPIRIEVTVPSANYYCNVASCVVSGDNTWYTIEVELFANGGAANGGTLRMWLNDALVLEYCPTCSAQITIAGPLNATKGYSLGEYLNGSCCAGGVNKPAQQQSVYIDDVMVSTQRIGASTPPDSEPPAAPTNLRVVAP